MEIKRVRSKVVMLPTENKSDIVLHESNRLGYLPELSRNTDWEFVEKDWNSLHLYFTSDEDIKEDDWFIQADGGSGTPILRKLVSEQEADKTKGKVNYYPYYRNSDFLPTKGWGCKKVVASTDTSLGLPQPTTAFNKKYVELGGIDEVDLEYEDGFEYGMYLHNTQGYVKVSKIKVDSHNTITTHAIKNNWSREEVEKLCRSAFNAGVDIQKAFHKSVEMADDFIGDLPGENRWIKENL